MTFPACFRLVLIALVVSGCVAAVTFPWDQPVRDRIVASQEPKWSKSPEGKMHGAIRKWGDWPWIMVAATLGVVLAQWRGNRRWRRILLAAMVASTLAGMLANASRLTTGRTRPRESPKIEQGFYGPYHEGRLLIGVPAYNSFPSGHTATAFGFAAVVVLASPVWGLLVLIPASLVAWSSIVIGAHHPSDVAVSIVLSFAVGWGVWRITTRRFPLL